MQYIGDVPRGSDLIRRDDAIARNREALQSKMARLQDRQDEPCSGQRVKCLQYQLSALEKGAQRIREKITNLM